MSTKKYDVVILGGGTSGCACAYNCAKNNLKTLLIEKNNFLGGLMTSGLVIPVMISSVSDLNCDYYKKLVRTAKKFNSQITYKFLDKVNDGWFNPEMLKIVLEDILSSKYIKKNIDILFESTISEVKVKNKKIASVNVSSKMLSLPVVSKHYVDASGSGYLAKKSKCRFLSNSGLKQENSLRFILSNVDTKKFVKFLKSLNDDLNITNTYRSDIDTNNEVHFTTATVKDGTSKWKLDRLLKQGVKAGLLKENDRNYFQIFSIAGGIGQVSFNCPRISNYNDDMFKYSNELINAKRAIYRLYNFVKTKFPGFENSIITNIATQTGIREENRVKTKYIYTKEDMINSNEFKTPVLCANYGIDIHSNKKNKNTNFKHNCYSLPIESLMSADIDNLFVIGKILGADFVTHSALRVQKSCMSMGEGVAKYIASL